MPVTSGPKFNGIQTYSNIFKDHAIRSLKPPQTIKIYQNHLKSEAPHELISWHWFIPEKLKLQQSARSLKMLKTREGPHERFWSKLSPNRVWYSLTLSPSPRKVLLGWVWSSCASGHCTSHSKSISYSGNNALNIFEVRKRSRETVQIFVNLLKPPEELTVAFLVVQQGKVCRIVMLIRGQPQSKQLGWSSDGLVHCQPSGSTRLPFVPNVPKCCSVFLYRIVDIWYHVMLT